jgi:hypothetical protein
MGTMKEPFTVARSERYTHSRRHAEMAVATALLVCEARGATDAQLADLADAVEALRDKQYRVATILAEAAIERRNPGDKTIRPWSMSRSLVEIRAMLAAIGGPDRR